MKQQANMLKDVNSLENSCDGVLLITVAVWKLTVYKNVTSLQMLSCEICEVLQNIIFKENAGELPLISRDILDVSLVLKAITQLII